MLLMLCHTKQCAQVGEGTTFCPLSKILYIYTHSHIFIAIYKHPPPTPYIANTACLVKTIYRAVSRTPHLPSKCHCHQTAHPLLLLPEGFSMPLCSRYHTVQLCINCTTFSGREGFKMFLYPAIKESIFHFLISVVVPSRGSCKHQEKYYAFLKKY